MHIRAERRPMQAVICKARNEDCQEVRDLQARRLDQCPPQRVRGSQRRALHGRQGAEAVLAFVRCAGPDQAHQVCLLP